MDAVVPLLCGTKLTPEVIIGQGAVVFSPEGLRGGNWNNTATNLQVSDRNNAGWTNTNRNNNVGFRPAKTICPA